MGRVYVKEEVCMGCHLCEVYCQLKHAKSKDILKAFKRETQRPLSRIRMEENGPVAFSLRCQHCEDAPCVKACITGAIQQNHVDGVVRVDDEKCVGCWTCLLVCPFGAIGRDTVRKKTVRCDLCEGEDIPVCVANCPNEALVYVADKEEISV